MLPGCRHYLREAFIINQIAICYYCDKEFLITRDLAKREKVHCSECTISRKKKIKAEDVTEFLSGLENK
jgi:hypothetical protein